MSDDTFDPSEYSSDPLELHDIWEAHYRDEYPTYEALYDAVIDWVPDSPEGAFDLIENYLDDLSYEELLDLFADWGEGYADFWDWFRDEFYGEG